MSTNLTAGAAPLVGVGQPSGQVTADPGTLYTDLAATAGAWLWLKASGTGNTGWTVVHGDTGWRQIASTATNVTGNFLARRFGSVVTMRAGSADLTSGGSVATPEVPWSIPAGWRPQTSTVRWLYGSGGGTPNKVMSAGSNAIGLFSVPISSAIQLPEISWSTVDAWPATLPGSAA